MSESPVRQLPPLAADMRPEGGVVLWGDGDFELIDRRYGEMYNHLKTKAQPGRLPGRRDFDPIEVPHMLSCINLVEVVRVENRMRFKFRLHGTRQTALAARDVTGLFVEEAVLPECVDRIQRNMRLVCETRCPVYDRFPMPYRNRDIIDSERVYYPLAADGLTVDILLILNGYPEIDRPKSGKSSILLRSADDDRER